MGFNKTADGRVFFTTSNDDDELDLKAEKPQTPQAPKRQAPDVRPLTRKPLAQGTKRPDVLSEQDQMQAQILGVLKSVNERLITTKKERDQMRKDLERYKGVVDDLQSKSESATQLPDYAERRFDVLNDKVVNALAKSIQLERKVDKMATDRDRMIRKIDRIENQVIKTHDLLIAQRPAQQVIDARKVLPKHESAAEDTVVSAAPRFILDDDEMALPWWKRSKAFAVLTLLALFIVGIVGGWLINQQQQSATIEAVSTFSEPNQNDLNAPDLIGAGITDPRTLDFGEVLADERNLFGEPDNSVASDTINIDELNELMETNPGEVAEKLNALEPSAIPDTPKELPAPKKATQTTAASQSAVQKPAQLKQNDIKPASQPVVNITPDPALSRALKSIEAQALAGNAEAQHDLAAIYTAGHGGAPQNYDRAARWFEVAANNGVANAAYNLGVLNHQGIGRAANLKEAIQWYKTAANFDHPEAQYNLGIAYVEGIGVPYDPARASDYFRNAAAQGMMEAAYNLGLIYENGLLGDAKPQQALAWYKTAADKGSPEAKAALEKLSASLNVPVSQIRKQVAPTTQQAAAPISIVRTNNTPSSAELIAAAQQQLMRTGYYPGPVNGRMGPIMEDAVRTYQALHNMQVNGQVSQTLLTHLNAQSSSGQARLNQ